LLHHRQQWTEELEGTSSQFYKQRRPNDSKKATKPVLFDSEGQPYELGKASWIAEVNKLGWALYPSCTHIWKQTYEDMHFKEQIE